MINLPYSLIIEATDDPAHFTFYSPELEGFSGVALSIEACICSAKSKMAEYVKTLLAEGKAVPATNPHPTVTIMNAAVPLAA